MRQRFTWIGREENDHGVRLLLKSDDTAERLGVEARAPTRAPVECFGWVMSASMLSAFTLPPYRIGPLRHQRPRQIPGG